MDRLRSICSALHALHASSLIHYDADAPLTERAAADKEHKQLCELILSSLREVRTRLDALTVEARKHIGDFDRCLVISSGSRLDDAAVGCQSSYLRTSVLPLMATAIHAAS
jgi:hypothetical protein